jgi:hypothetical protein
VDRAGPELQRNQELEGWKRSHRVVIPWAYGGIASGASALAMTYAVFRLGCFPARLRRFFSSRTPASSRG